MNFLWLILLTFFFLFLADYASVQFEYTFNYEYIEGKLLKFNVSPSFVLVVFEAFELFVQCHWTSKTTIDFYETKSIFFIYFFIILWNLYVDLEALQSKWEIKNNLVLFFWRFLKSILIVSFFRMRRLWSPIELNIHSIWLMKHENNYINKLLFPIRKTNHFFSGYSFRLLSQA